MKKIDNHGFMMAEVVVVSAIIIGILGFMFISYNKILTLYKTRIRYYDTVTLYRLGFYRDILIENNVINNILDTAKRDNKKVTVIYTSKNNSNSIVSLPAAERAGFEDDSVYLIYNNQGNLDKNVLNSYGIKETFKDYMEFLSTSVDFRDRTNFVMVMERCNAETKNVNDCSYAYVDVYDGYELSIT